MADKRVLILAAHEPTADPRLGWWASSLSRDCEVFQIGFAEGAFATPTKHKIIRLPTQPGAPTVFCPLLDPMRGDYYSVTGDSDFRWYQRFFIERNELLFPAAARVGRSEIIIACDLFTLPAALALAEASGARVVYDAHEFWPHSLNFPAEEIEYWSRLERDWCSRADLRVTVSPPLAAAMSRAYGCDFLSIPNCCTLSDGEININKAIESRRDWRTAHFLYLGNYAPHRGLENLVRNWPDRPDARLALRGPVNDYQRRLASLSDNKRISFQVSAPADRLVSAASWSDVGIIPYDPSNLNNRLACPNKLSQYLAAGLPVLCSDMEYVRSVIEPNQLGMAVDFSDRRALADAVDQFLALGRDGLATAARRSRDYFVRSFNWEVTSREALDTIRRLLL